VVGGIYMHVQPERAWKEAAETYWRYYPKIFLEEMMEITKNFCQNY
jgi:hypothetical protein